MQFALNLSLEGQQIIAFSLKLDRRIQMADFKPIRCLKYAPQLKRSIIVKSVMAFLLLCGTLDNFSCEREKLQVVQSA